MTLAEWVATFEREVVVEPSERDCGIAAQYAFDSDRARELLKAYTSEALERAAQVAEDEKREWQPEASAVVAADHIAKRLRALKSSPAPSSQTEEQ